MDAKPTPHPPLGHPLPRGERATGRTLRSRAPQYRACSSPANGSTGECVFHDWFPSSASTTARCIVSVVENTKTKNNTNKTKNRKNRKPNEIISVGTSVQ